MNHRDWDVWFADVNFDVQNKNHILFVRISTQFAREVSKTARCILTARIAVYFKAITTILQKKRSQSMLMCWHQMVSPDVIKWMNALCVRMNLFIYYLLMYHVECQNVNPFVLNVRNHSNYLLIYHVSAIECMFWFANDNYSSITMHSLIIWSMKPASNVPASMCDL